MNALERKYGSQVDAIVDATAFHVNDDYSPEAPPFRSSKRAGVSIRSASDGFLNRRRCEVETASLRIAYLLSLMSTAVSHLIDFCTGRLEQRTLRRIFIPLIAASYFGSLILAIWLFPGPFDWRTRSMSKLLYPENNPQFHAIGSIGIAIAGLLMIPFAGYIKRRLCDSSRRAAEIGALAFGVGAISLIFGALIVRQPYHEMFARSAGICLGLGLVAFYWCALRAFSAPPDDGERDLRIFLAWSPIVPAALLVVLLRLLAGAHFQWSSPIYRALENRSLWHLGFWEWMISIAVILFLYAATVFLPEND